MKYYLRKVGILYEVQWHMSRYRVPFVYLWDTFNHLFMAWFLFLISPAVFIWAATKCLWQPFRDAARNSEEDCLKSLRYRQKQTFNRRMETRWEWWHRFLPMPKDPDE